MALKIDYIQDVCKGFTNYVEARYPGLVLKYILHHRGQRNDAIEMERNFFNDHPAGSVAHNILKKSKATQQSGFHGLAVQKKRYFFGLKKKLDCVGVMTINLDDYGTDQAVLADIYHYGCHAIETYNLLNHPKYKDRFTQGPLIPKRSPLSLAKVNLLADIFSVLILAHQGYESMIQALASERSLNTMLAKPNGRPWHFPYPLAYQATEKIWTDIIGPKNKNYDPIKTPLDMAHSLLASYEDESFTQWWAFCEPAQEMAWYGELPETILGAALHTSDNPLVKANAILVESALQMSPADETALEGKYNAFVKEETQVERHSHKVEETFELILAQGILKESSRPFMEAANAQNIQLAEGKIFGWCASALQSAGRAFESALSGQREPSQAAQIEFKGAQLQIKYDGLKSVSNEIMKRRQAGQTVTVNDVKDVVGSSEDTFFIERSIETTMNDPEYEQMLDAALTPAPIVAPKAPGPSGPAPNSPAPKVAPQAAPQASMPGMGAGPMSGGLPSSPPDSQKRTAEDQTENEKQGEKT